MKHGPDTGAQKPLPSFAPKFLIHFKMQFKIFDAFTRRGACYIPTLRQGFFHLTNFKFLLQILSQNLPPPPTPPLILLLIPYMCVFIQNCIVSS